MRASVISYIKVSPVNIGKEHDIYGIINARQRQFAVSSNQHALIGSRDFRIQIHSWLANLDNNVSVRVNIHPTESNLVAALKAAHSGHH